MVLSSGAQQQSVKSLARREDQAGLIDGTVFYKDGRPVKGATVYALPLGRPMTAIVPHSDTDETGYFVIHISRSWFGKFAVAAKKAEADWSNRDTNCLCFQTQAS